MLECPGVFTVPLIPEGWTATSEGGSFFELQPADREAAVHISVYRREPAALEPGQAESYLRKFVERRPPDGPVSVRVVPGEQDEERAFAKLTEWFAGCILWPAAMLMCSCNAPPGHGALKEAEIMIASIFQGTEG
jgi:hypothetical protein